MQKTNQPLLNICVPNFNYGRYIDKTLKSLKKQNSKNFAINIVDNASTDNSLDVIKKWRNEFANYNFKVNPCNLGFAGNLDKVASMSSGPYKIMISSDDVVIPEMTAIYESFIKNRLKNNPNEEFIFGSIPVMIDSEGKFIKEMKTDSKLWLASDLDKNISKQMGFNVYKVSSSTMLERCLRNFRTPLHFLTTCYSHKTYSNIGGYGGGRIYNPDKWFSWKALSRTQFIYLIEKPLFKYRWHNSNQQAIEKETRVLKYWYDEYRNSFEIDNTILSKTKYTTSDIVNFYNEHLIKHILHAIKSKDKHAALRLVNWGKACYPNEFGKAKYFKRLKILLICMPLSSILLQVFFRKKGKTVR